MEVPGGGNQAGFPEESRLMLPLFKFKGGVKPATHKTDSTTQPIGQVPLPAELVIPLHQSVGGTPRPLVQAGDVVKKGQTLITFDMDAIKAAGYDVTTPLIVTNTDDYEEVKMLAEGTVNNGSEVLEVK